MNIRGLGHSMTWLGPAPDTTDRGFLFPQAVTSPVAPFWVINDPADRFVPLLLPEAAPGQSMSISPAFPGMFPFGTSHVRDICVPVCSAGIVAIPAPSSPLPCTNLRPCQFPFPSCGSALPRNWAQGWALDMSCLEFSHGSVLGLTRN